MIEKEVYEQVLAKAVEDAKKSFHQIFGTLTNDGIIHAKTVEQFIDDVYQGYQEEGIFDKDTLFGKEARDTSFAACRALQILYGLSAGGEIKDNLDKFFNDTKNNEWFESKGITDEEKKSFLDELKNTIDERILGDDHSNSNKKFVQGIKDLYDVEVVMQQDRYNRKQNFMLDSFAYIEWMNKEILEKHNSALTVSREDFKGTALRKAADKAVAGWLCESIFDYVTDISHSMNTAFSYDKHDGVNPREFLKHFKKDPKGLSKLSKEEKEWANHQLNRIMGEVQSNYKSEGAITYNDFMADGKPIISNEESDKVEKGEAKLDTISTKIIASLLDGKDVNVKPKDTLNHLHINPMICDKTIETWWEEFLHSLANFLGFNTEKDDIEKMNEDFKKTAEHEVDSNRHKTSFDELKDFNPFDRVSSSENTTSKEKAKENDTFSL